MKSFYMKITQKTLSYNDSTIVKHASKIDLDKVSPKALEFRV